MSDTLPRLQLLTRLQTTAAALAQRTRRNTQQVLRYARRCAEILRGLDQSLRLDGSFLDPDYLQDLKAISTLEEIMLTLHPTILEEAESSRTTSDACLSWLQNHRSIWAALTKLYHKPFKASARSWEEDLENAVKFDEWVWMVRLHDTITTKTLKASEERNFSDAILKLERKFWANTWDVRAAIVSAIMCVVHTLDDGEALIAGRGSDANIILKIAIDLLHTPDSDPNSEQVAILMRTLRNVWAELPLYNGDQGTSGQAIGLKEDPDTSQPPHSIDFSSKLGGDSSRLPEYSPSAFADPVPRAPTKESATDIINPIERRSKQIRRAQAPVDVLKSTAHASQTHTSSLSSNPSVAGPSTTPGPISQTAAATLTLSREIGMITINLISGWQKRTSTAQVLIDVLQSSLITIDALLNTTETFDHATLDRLKHLNTILYEVHRTARAEVHPRKRHVVKGRMMKLVGATPADVFPLCQTRVVSAFQALELTLPAPKPTIPTNTPQQLTSTFAVGRDTPPLRRPGSSEYAKTALDTSETVLQFPVGLGEVVVLAEPILKAVRTIGLAIIKILDGVINNKEEAQSLAKYVGDLVAMTERSREAEFGETTVIKLRALEATLKSVQSELESFVSQGGFRQGVSHIRNREVLVGCDTQIRQSFTQLQVNLSLDTVRLLATFGDADSQQKRRNLLDRLGDANTRAMDKASDPADLMCLEGTRVELLDEADRWASDPSSQRVLWINGVAGCGKSAIAATIAARREEQSATAIFHFSRSDQLRNKRVVCSIARQLAQKVARGTESFPEDLVLSTMQADPDIADAHLSTQFKNLLVDPLSNLMPGSPPVLIIIDALDEWDNEVAAARLVHLIHEHNARLPSSIKFILTSRRVSHLCRAFSVPRITSFVKSLALDFAPRVTVDQDIRIYLTESFNQIRSGSSEIPAGHWPGKQAIEKLVTLSGGLFQWASAVIRFVGKGSHPVRLKEIFARPNQLGDLDALYQSILNPLLQTDTRTSTSTLLQHVLGSIVVAPTRISLETLAYLHADSLESTHDATLNIEEILEALGSLLIIPASPNEAIRTLHPSFAHFLTDRKRCIDPRFYVDLPAQSRRMALLCIQRMLRDLKRDICGVENPTKFNADPNVRELVSKHIPGPLRYVCCYWAEHLLTSGVENCDEVEDPLGAFCASHMLFWLEVMGLISMVPQAVVAIKMVEQWLTQCSPTKSITQALLHDARRFVLMYSEPISANAAHIYLSALSTVPSETELARYYRKLSSIGPRVLAGPIMEYWPSSLWAADRPSGAVSCLEISPDGTTITSGSDDHTVRLWDVESGVQRRLDLEGHAQAIRSVAFSPDGSTIASGSDDCTLRLWDAETGMRRGTPLVGHTGEVTCIALEPAGRILASGSADCTLRLWDIEAGVQSGPTLVGHTGRVNCLAISSDGRMVASGSDDNTLRVWDIEAGAQSGPTLVGHTRKVTSLALSSDGRTAASGSVDCTLRLWDTETMAQKGQALKGHAGEVTCIALEPAGRILASGSADCTLRLWDIEAGVQSGPTLVGHTGRVNCLAFSSDGRMVASGSDDNTLRVWDVEKGVQKGTLEGHTDAIRCLVFSADGKAIVSGSSDNTLHCWDVETGFHTESRLAGHTGKVTCHAFSADGEIIASGSDDYTLRLWDAETGVQSGKEFSLPSVPHILEFSSDGRRIIVKADPKTIISEWDLGTKARLFPVPSDQSISVLRSLDTEVEIRMGRDGWVVYGSLRWFWLPAAFGRSDVAELRGNRLVFHHGCYVCIIDVSEIMFLIS